jgi:hypothetical protein
MPEKTVKRRLQDCDASPQRRGRSFRLSAGWSRPSSAPSRREQKTQSEKKKPGAWGVNYSAGPNARRSNDRTPKGGALAM